MVTDLFYVCEKGSLRWRAKSSKKQMNNIGEVAGSPNKNGYISVMVMGKRFMAHHIAWEIHHGFNVPHGFEIDHIDHNPGNQAKDNLRLVKRSDNAKNLSMSKANTSGVTGVSLFKKTGKWKASIKHNGKTYHLGYFHDIEEARKARADAEVKFNFHKNHGDKNVNN